MRRVAASIGAWIGAVSLLLPAAQGQVRPAGPGLGHASAPLLYVRIAGPEGMKVTFFRGEPAGVTVAAPCVIGVRPGYGVRFELSNIRGFPGATFSPMLEARGSLTLASQLRNADFPATLLFREDDFAKVEQGALLKRIIVLEQPDTATPEAARADRPLEFFVAPARDPYQEARERGAPLAVMHLGHRSYTREELAATALPGTILLPGEKALPMPRVGPTVPWACYQVFDPLHGPASPAPYMSIPDGGDSGLRAGYDGAGRLRGVDPSDTVAEYVDATGRPRVVCSNRVAICVPRFVIIRSESGLASQTIAMGPDSARLIQGRSLLDGRIVSLEHAQRLYLEGSAGRIRPGGTDFTAGTAITGRTNGVDITATIRVTNTLDGSCPPPTAALPQRPLRIIKWPDKKCCLVGDLVLFSLQYTNQGSEPITSVVVSDSLAPRFEYVPGSQKTDRAASFTTQPNEAGSTLLRWEFAGALQPGETGLITFQVRVR